jgi:hypothetical protein
LKLILLPRIVFLSSKPQVLNTCKSCKYWRYTYGPVKDHRTLLGYQPGNCHKRAPVIGLQVTTGTPDQRPLWPQVSSEESCGDYELVED